MELASLATCSACLKQACSWANASSAQVRPPSQASCSHNWSCRLTRDGWSSRVFWRMLEQRQSAALVRFSAAVWLEPDEKEEIPWKCLRNKKK